MLYICYLLKPASGGSYIGVTGISLRKRVMVHLRERFQGEIEIEILATRSTREEINEIETVLIAELQPTLNRIKGGTSHPAKRRDPDAFCRQGHWRESSYRKPNGTLVCRKCRQDQKRKRRIAKRGA